jgi:hypothetical protein
MFLSEMLSTAIQAERDRDAERRSRDRRLLHPAPDGAPARVVEKTAALVAQPSASPRQTKETRPTCEAA